MKEKKKSKDQLKEEVSRLQTEISIIKSRYSIPRDADFLEYGGEDEWQVMMDMLGDYIFVVDPSGSIIKTNPVVSQKLGYSKEELCNMNIFSLYPDDRAVEAEEIYSQIIMGERFLCEVPFRSKNGALIEVETKVTPGKWRKRNVIFSISRDVSAGKIVEYEMRIAFEKLKTIIDSISAYIWSALADREGRFWYIFQSSVVESITGRSHGYFLPGAEKWLTVIHEEDRGRIEEMYSRLIKGESSREEATYRIVHHDGSTRWVRDSILAREFGESQLRLDGIITDITERKLAIEALKESESRLRGILSSMTDMVFAFDTETRFTFFHTPEMGNLYIEPVKFTGERHADVMPEEIEKHFNEAFNSAREGKESEYEYWLTVGGEERCFTTRLSPIMHDGTFNGAVAVIRDITRIKLLENELMKSEGFYHDILNSINEGYILLARDGKVVTANSAMLRMLNYNEGDLKGLTCWDIIPSRQHSLAQKMLASPMTGNGKPEEYVMELMRNDGSGFKAMMKVFVFSKNVENDAELCIIVADMSSDDDE